MRLLFAALPGQSGNTPVKRDLMLRGAILALLSTRILVGAAWRG